MSALVPELLCTDLPASIEFYTEILGFDLRYDRPEEFFAYLSLGGADIMLQQIQDIERTWVSGPMKQPFGRGVNFQIEVPNVNAIYERVQKTEDRYSHFYGDGRKILRRQR